jgi:hypothetical protein
MLLTVASRPWPEVVEFYRALVVDSGWDLRPMLELIEKIASSPYATGLFPATSLARLCLARTRTIRWNHEMLTVQYDPVGGRFLFEYFEASPSPKPWVTSCPAAEGRARLEWLLKKRLRWFRELGTTATASP